MNDEWTDDGMCDAVYYLLTHIPCGTKVQILMGHCPVCPKCQPGEWAKLKEIKCPS